MHSSFFEILSQLGIFGIVTYYWIWFTVFKSSYVAWRAAGGQEKMILSGLISAVLSCLLYSFGELQFYKIELASVSWFTAGLLVAYSALITPRDQVVEVLVKTQPKQRVLGPF